MKRLLATVAVVAAMVGSSASAFDPAHLKRLMETNECKGCELSNANLMGAKLRGAILVEAILAMNRHPSLNSDKTLSAYSKSARGFKRRTTQSNQTLEFSKITGIGII